MEAVRGSHGARLGAKLGARLGARLVLLGLLAAAACSPQSTEDGSQAAGGGPVGDRSLQAPGTGGGLQQQPPTSWRGAHRAAAPTRRRGESSPSSRGHSYGGDSSAERRLRQRRKRIPAAVEYILEGPHPPPQRAHHHPPTSRQRRSRQGRRYRQRHDLALWIDHQQVQRLSGYPMEIYVIREGRVLPYILDPHFNSRLPVIPAEVSSFNFTWQGGRRKRYRYQLDNLLSDDSSVMGHPTVSIPSKGRLPRRPKGFRIDLPCLRNASGVARFSVRLKLKTRHNKRIHGTPINVRLRKRCAPIELLERSWDCPVGYLGPNCSEALCYPHCLHGGVCTAPGRCSCPAGYHGRYCQGGICSEKCLNGGKCIQKDRCSCTRGFYGPTCQYSKCAVPCVNGGVCRGANKCRCPAGFGGLHCEVVKQRGSSSARAQRCSHRCKHGSCADDASAQCLCAEGYTGRWCRRRTRDRRGRVWLR